MDMLILFMLFCTLIPFLLWFRRRGWTIFQLPFVIGMWVYFFHAFMSNRTDSVMNTLLTLLFYGNLVFTEVSFIRLCIDIGNDLKKRKPGQSI